MSTEIFQFDFNFDRGAVVRSAVDPCERKHKGNAQSIEAHKRVLHSKQETYKRIMALISSRGEFGATSKEIAYAFGVELNTISGRCSELKTMRWIKESGEKRNNAAVLVCEGQTSHSPTAENQGAASAL